MAVLQKIRVKLGILITVLIAVALLAFIIDPTQLETTIRSLSSKYDVGKIDGKKISYNDFQENLEYYDNVYTLSTGNQSKSQEVMDQINEMTWQSMIQDNYVIPRIKKAGVRVGDEELIDLSQGKEISPLLQNNPVFKDESGNFSRERFLDFVHAIPSDESGNLSMYWGYIQNLMLNQQYFLKYSSLQAIGTTYTPIELRREIEENNVTSNVDFVMVPMGFDNDTTIKVSDKEIRDYYDAHKEAFVQTASRDVEFVAYEVVPSEEDIDATEAEINKLFPEFSETDNLKVFLARNSDTPLNPFYFKEGDLASSLPEIDEFAFSKNPTVLPVFRKDNTFYAARVADIKTMPDSVFVNHILLAADAENLADSLINVLNKGGKFTELADQYSLDKNPNVKNPGEIGWMTQYAMIPGMESVLDLQPGKIAKMHTNYGIHIVKVTDRTKPVKKAQIAVLSREAVASKDTYSEYYAQANDLVSRCEGKIENFTKITQEDNLPVIPVNGVLESAKQLSRYENVREVVRWIYEADEDEISPIITVDNNIFFVVAVKQIRKDGYASVNDVAPSINYLLMNQKRAEKLRDQVAAKIKGLTDINAIADALNQTVSHKDQVAFGSITDGSVEPALIGAIAGAEVNKIAGPVIGNMGVYVVNVNSRETGAFYKESDADMKTKKLQSFQVNILPGILVGDANVVDHRAKFF